MYILAGDIGGTNTRLALFEAKDGLKVIKEKKYPSKDYPSLLEIIRLFLEGVDSPIEGASFGVAGPVKEGKCKATNLAWVVDVKEIQEDLKTLSVFLLNDLEANAWGLSTLKEGELFVLNEGKEHSANKALISAGTGLGEACLYWDGKMHHPFATEGGHVDFAPRDELEMELLRYMRKIFDHVSFERVLCGSGLYLLYRFLTEMQLEKGSEALSLEFSLKDPASVITDKALKKEDRASMRALDWFISIYASAAGNLALKFLSLGGLYIGGGIAPKILPAINPADFVKIFSAKGRFAPLLSDIPLKVVLNDLAALQGSAFYAKTKLT